MRSLLGTVLAPGFAVAALFLAAFVPPPSEIAMAFKPIGSEVNVVTAAGDPSNEREALNTIAGRIKLAAGPAIGDNADCFDDLALADQTKLDRCGRVVYQALAEVERDPRVFETDVAHADPRALVQELRLAATEVCREKWARTGRVPADSKTCQLVLADLEVR